MNERTPKELAESIVNTSLRHIIRPDDDMGLDDWAHTQGVRRNLHDSLIGAEFKPIIDHLPVSPFFREYLAFEFHELTARGFDSGHELLETIKTTLGISLKDDEYGACDPERALSFESTYFNDIAFDRLNFMEQVGSPGPVDWLEWQKDLNRRIIEGI